MQTRVARLEDGRLVAVTRQPTTRRLELVVFGQDGGVVARHLLGTRTDADAGGGHEDGGWWPSVAVAGETIHVVWRDAAQGRLLYAKGRAESGFGAVGIIDGDGPADVGTHTSLAVGTDGSVHVAYRDETARSLKYAVQAPAGEWRVMAVPPCAGETNCPVVGREDAGTFTSIVLVPAAGGAETPRIAFRDELRGDLKLAARVGNGDAFDWQVTTLDGRDETTGADTGDVGRFASLALTPSRNLAVVYLDETRGALRALTPGNPARTLDDGVVLAADGRRLGSFVGQFARLQIDADGTWHVLHLDASRFVWKYVSIAGEQVERVEALEALRPGGWLDFRVQDGVLTGAYGAFEAVGSLVTRLQWFEVQP
jgi:hypothetical protein